MGAAELFLLSVGLSMDAFAVSICKGLSIQRGVKKMAAGCGLWFGGFQALMPLIGYLLGVRFSHLIQAVDHWIAFVLLSLIGGNMIRECIEEMKSGGVCPVDQRPGVRHMAALALATSIDALAVGVTFAFLGVHIFRAVSLIGIMTCIISGTGVWVGHQFGCRFKHKAELAGGVILILIGLKILLSHLGIISL